MTTKESAAIPTLRDLQFAIQALPCVHPGTVPQLQTAYEAGHRHALRQAGEFVAERLAATQPVPGPILSDEREAFENYFCMTLSCDDSNPQELIDACRIAAYDAWRYRANLAAVPGLSEPVAWCLRSLNGKIVYWNESRQNVEMNQPYVKTSTTVEGIVFAAQPAPVSGAKSDEKSSIAIVMANVMFNFAQKRGHTLTEADCELFDRLRKRCDAASPDVAAPAGPVVDKMGVDKNEEM